MTLHEQFRKECGIDLMDTETLGVFPYFKNDKWGSIQRGEGWKRYAEWLESLITRLSVEVTDEEIDKQADYKYDNTSIQRSAWIGGAKWMRDRLTQKGESK